MPAGAAPGSEGDASPAGEPASAGSGTPGGEDAAGGIAGGPSGQEGSPQPAGDGGSGTPGMTTEETIGVLDGQLDASLTVFDGMILGERAAAQAMETPDDGGYGAGGSDEEEGEGSEGDIASAGGPLFEEGDLSESGDGGDGEEETVPPMPTGSSGSGGTLAGQPLPGGGTVPPDLVDGSDDDIVARQIREAAMKEKDPALREKLWDEYRKYKQGG